MKIGINCGHTIDGQPGSGAVGKISESKETRRVGNKLMLLMSKAGHIVYDCTDDYASSENANLNEIVRMANKQPLDLFVSIHFNSGGGRGAEVFTYGGKKHTEAVNVCAELNKLGFVNRGVKDGSHLWVIRHTNAKSMLIEVCFVDTDDADKYKKLGADKIAAAIYAAITGESAQSAIEEYTDVNDIVWELANRGIITDKNLWLQYCNNDQNIYWFCRKLCQYIRTKTQTENEKDEYTDIHNISWDLDHRGVISDVALWETLMKKDTRVYWLLRKGLHYVRTH